MILLHLFCILLFLGQSLSTSPVTTVAQGQLRGRWFYTRGGRKVAGFLGIPYVSSPVGTLRFRSPQPAKPWKGEFSATKDAPGCIQSVETSGIPTRPSVVSEDCLYLNVFSPCLLGCKRLPVLVYIHGGGLVQGAGFSSAYGPDYLLDENIVLVTFNYRLGILGFLSLEHPVLPGNLGLKDQRAALRWVRDNIAKFGGDKNKITIFGNSAGAGSVQLHSVFSAGEGLFRAAIADSGSSQTLECIQSPRSQKTLVERLRKMTNCPKDPVKLVECLRLLPAMEFETLRAELAKTSIDIKRQEPLFRHVVEPDCVVDALITTDPWNTTMSIPLLHGVNQLEGLDRTVEYEIDKTNRRFMELNEEYQTVLPYNMFFEDSAKNPEEVAEMLKQFYFGRKNIDRKHYINLVDLFTDAFFNYPLVVSTRKNKGKTFVYQMNYKGSNTFVHYLGSTAYYGVSHVDELFYLFPFGGPQERNITTRDTAFSKQMVKMWTNFVKYLDPTPNKQPVHWKPVATPSIEFLNIGQNSYKMNTNFLKERMDFWDDLPLRTKQQIGRPRCPPGSSQKQ